MTSHRIGVNLRVSGNCDQGARKYMEDNHVIKFLKKNTDDYEFAYFGIFDGHGGPEASAYCRDNLLNEITKYDGFWTNDDSQVLSAIRKGFLDTHNSMWSVIDSWPKTVTGLPSTAGSTATIAIIKQGKLYTGHVGDSALVLGENDAYCGPQNPVQAICVTKEHKPDDPDERLRIEDAGGEVINKSGVPRVVWSRPKTNHKGPVRRSTHIDQIPFLAVARSLGDLWSYDYYTETYVVSPDPDVAVLPLDPTKHRCLILASDGLWNMLTPEESVNMVMDLESQFEEKIITDPNVAVSFWSNPAERLVARALNKWRAKALKADNTSCVVVLVDPLGPSKLTLLKRKRQEMLSKGEAPSGSSSSSQTKMAKLHTESEFRTGSRSQGNKNANCSLSDSHIRVTDDSMIMPHSGRRSHVSVQQSPYGEGEDVNEDEDSINDSVQFFPRASAPLSQPARWNLRHPMEEKKNLSLNVVSTKTSQQRRDKTASQSFFHQGPEDDHFTSSHQSFTKLLEVPKYASTGRQHRDMSNLSQHFNPNRSSIVDIEEEDEEESDSVSDQGEEIPQPPPCTPCSGETSDSENTLHSSADVTDMAFSLASDESLGTPVRSLRGSHRTATPQSAPSKLSSTHSRANHLSKSARKKLARRNNLFTKPPSGQTVKHSVGVVKRSDAKAKVSSSSSSDTAPSSSMSFSIASSVEMKSAWARRSDGSKQDDYANASKSNNKVNTSMSTRKEIGTSHPSPPEFRSPPKRVLNTSRSMNDVATPAREKEPAKSLSCTGLTPSMGQLMSGNPSLHDHKSSLNVPTGFNSKDKSLRNKKLKTSSEENPHLNTSQISEPLKQLNKTSNGSSSRRWGNFFRGSKHSLEQMFHKGSKHGTAASKKLNTTSSTGVLEGKLNSSPLAVRTAKTSMSTSRLPDSSTVDHRHLPDITLSHYADLNSTTVMPGDLSALSAIDETEADYEDDSMLSLRDLELVNAHHSMLEEGVIASHRLTGGGKLGKRHHHRGFLQKTRVTLSRARKAAKKAFFPENNRLSKDKLSGRSGAGKRRSDEFLSTPDIKRRKHQEAEKV
ncbi:protein phosphatase 1D [Elysia marginata]|uniref:Protein phosphatase 1D n=1 Tax=Elysia marginata TaxID=1093978 RepID=A0AAV4IN12_9GAST|nr:protein phosphatase 1D [Elysia marginata]